MNSLTFMSYWFMSLLTGLPPAVWLTRTIARRRRRSADACSACGYDLRATPDRCPECGTVRARGAA